MTPRTLSHYRILERLGAGGMGEVYKAQDTKLAREVALKLLPADAVRDPDRLQRFKQEALATSALNHPNITTIYEVDESEGQHFISLEFVAGRTLRQLVREGRLEISRILDIGLQVAEGLAAAHASGVVHRDLKPENIMVRPDGIAKILDFGLAKLRARAPAAGTDETLLQAAPGSDSLTQQGMVLGTVAYMSPEQTRGQDLDHRSDIFSFGAILYEMVSSKPAFGGDSSVEVMHSIIREQPRPLQEMNADTPVELQRIIRKAMTKNPDERYQSAKDLAIDLRALKREIDSGAVSAVRTPVPGAGAPARGRARPLWLGFAVVLVVAAAGAFFWLRGARQPRTAAALRLSKLSASGKTSNPVFSPDGQFLAYETGTGALESIVIRQLATGSEAEVVPPREGVLLGNLCFSPDGNWLLYTSRLRTENIRTLWQVSALGGSPREVLREVDSPASFAPDGKRFVFHREVDGRPYVFFVANYPGGGDVHEVYAAPEAAAVIANPVWSPTGRDMAYVQVDRQDVLHLKLMIKPVDGGEPRPLPGPRWMQLTGYDWAPDGSGLYVSASRSWVERPQIWFVSLSGASSRRLTQDLDEYSAVALRRDGEALAAVRTTLESHLWQVRLDGSPEENAASARRITQGTYIASGPNVSPDGKKVVFHSDLDGQLNLWMLGVDETNPRQLTFDAAQDFGAAWAPDGRHIAYSQERDGVLQVVVMDPDGQNGRQVTRVGSTNFSPSWSPDGGSIAYLSADGEHGRLNKIPVEGGERVELYPDQDVFMTAQWSPDGHWIASWIQQKGSPLAQRELGLFPASGTGEVRKIPMEPPGGWPWPMLCLRWTPDSRGLVLIDVKNGIYNMEYLGLEDGARRPLTAFTDDEIIFGYGLTADARAAVVQRGRVNADVVLLENIR